MRPLRIELEGFASFRERTVIDFEGADLFVLSGPMGAGKSSVIDAMGFALYGAVARLDSARLVAPVISQGVQQCRVRLDFSVGPQTYTAVRIVRRNRTGGATTPEARLDRAGETLAATADEVTAAVTELLGLSFEQFTKCVVLPQGDFADLLHAKVSERQELLVRLLDIGVYRKVRERAYQRQVQADLNARYLQGRLEGELSNATLEAYREAERRVAVLRELQCRLDGEEDVLQTYRAAAEQARQAAAAAQALVDALGALAVPAGVADLDRRLKTAAEGLTAAQCEQREADEAVVALQQARDLLPERAAIDAVVAGHEQKQRYAAAIASGREALQQAQAALAAAEDGVERAGEAAERAEAERGRLERAHSAYHASRGLRPGDVCPVCGEKLTATPALAEPPDLAAANTAWEKARRSLKAADDTRSAARVELARRELALDQGVERLEALEKQLAGGPSLQDCRELRLAVDTAEAALAGGKSRAAAARKAVESAEKALDALRREEQKAWSAYHVGRDPFAALGAPQPDEGGLEASWLGLRAWAAEAGRQHLTRCDQARTAEEDARSREAALLESQAEACRDVGLALNGARPRDAVLAARGRAEQELGQIDDRLAERERVAEDLAACSETKRVSGLLATHLQTNHFEKWYLLEAMARLTRSATQRLRELTRDQYSLRLNRTNTDFVVIDHVNADEERPVRTLSGGETFLASLALALALGDEVAGLAARGASRLESLFLDEGFGTLDADTLETVASTIEELGARGRMVGIITHVPELAQRIPVQYRVFREGRVSRVERLEGR
jgi:exonuclease SbcC